jgi:arylsulfatase A
MNLRFLSGWAVLAAVVGLVPAAEAAEAVSRPNFLVILCDDLGYGDLGCNGHPTIRTPYLDRLAAQGLRLTDCYAAAPVCSPSRAGLLTGRTPSRLGVYSWIPAEHPMHLAREEITIATLLQKAGYRTAHVGKWHLNGRFPSDQQPQPGDHGFDHWFSTQNIAVPSHQNPTNFIRNGQAVGALKGFSCQLVTDEAIQWLKQDRARKSPFFLFVCYHEPHEPVASPPELVTQYLPQARNEDQAQYFANVANMDQAVGRLLAALDELKAADDTLVFFTSDNGPETLKRYPGAQRSYGSPGPLRGMKLHLYEGGIRVPGLLRWPGHVKPGQVSREPFTSLDLLPTFCQLAGVKIPADRPIDGSNFLPILDGKPIERRTPLFWHYYRSIGEPKAALREGDWMILGHWDQPVLPGSGAALRPGDMEIIKRAKLKSFELYNLRTDLGETRDLASQEPERLRTMSKQLTDLYTQVIAEGRSWNVPGPKPK